MSSSYIHDGEHGFWCSDSLLEIAFHLLGDEISRACRSAWCDEYGAGLRSQAQAGMSGCLTLGLDELKSEQREVVTRAARSAIARTEQEPDVLAPSRLNALGLGGGGVYQRPVDPRLIVSTLSVLVQLIDGQWRWTVSDDEAQPHRWLIRERHAPGLDDSAR